ncbi:uncharacterized protein MYCFIDRAFT_72591 [Pseudocercospora fijiensis CIRAD86]|uniref:Cytokinesis regulator n=1 Tax=Pseudocercospora fijiensis (strain CIRAD86) TaxID=383855 RepID=M3A5B8_PSEFD|nr:uncharacterized protein MYCFIDRAFT_72591 [Pseudocercospora fijiensis CIRAD86]EME86314.1 hypothetical protein MYCFIDRAFT_72591 [Pseudocercospora fijiensis CIRAD86]
MECWDDDADLQGDFTACANASTGTGPLSMSSRISTRSESVAGDEDWNVVIQPNDEHSSKQAILSAKLAGIPLPQNVPTSALLGGTIKRLGNKPSKQKIDDWDNDLEMMDKPLQLKPRTEAPGVLSGEDFDDFDDLEGSLGIRFAGKNSTRNRSGSASVMSPSLGSATADSEVDDLGGLELPEGPMDFEAILKKRRAADADLTDSLPNSQPNSAVVDQQPTMNLHKKSKLFSDDHDNFLDDLDFGESDVINVRKRTTNRNVQVKSTKPLSSSSRPATTLNFHDKPTDKPIYNRSHIPRPVSGTRHTSRLDPVFESGASHAPRERRGPTTTSSQLLRSKRSAPALRNQHSHGILSSKPSVPFLPAGVSNHQSPHITAHRAMPYHLRRDSDPKRQGAQSPPPRPSSRLSNQVAPDTPSRVPRARENIAPPSLAREARSKQTIKQPNRRRHYGDGSELEIFDDLPTSVTKESKFIKQPVGRGPPKQSTLRRTQSRSDFVDLSKRNSAISTVTAIPDRIMTPAPPRTPASPTKGFYDNVPSATPSYLRDTAASRIARETRLANQPRPRSEGPLQPLTTNWKAQVAARSPFNSPSAQRQKSKRPGLIAGIGSHVVKSEKGMIYNPQTLRWEGNENTLREFDIPPLETPTPSLRPRSSYIERERMHQRSNTSPSRPALIAHVPTGSGYNIQVQNGMVFDPQQMKWLKVKAGRDVSGQMSPSVTDVEDEEDAFAGIDDLKDENNPTLGTNALGGAQDSLQPPGADFHEEFDVGDRFKQLQENEEQVWRRMCGAWFVNNQERPDDGRWRRAIRDVVPAESMAGF